MASNAISLKLYAIRAHWNSGFGEQILNAIEKFREANFYMVSSYQMSPALDKFGLPGMILDIQNFSFTAFLSSYPTIKISIVVLGPGAIILFRDEVKEVSKINESLCRGLHLLHVRSEYKSLIRTHEQRRIQ